MNIKLNTCKKLFGTIAVLAGIFLFAINIYGLSQSLRPNQIDLENKKKP